MEFVFVVVAFLISLMLGTIFIPLLVRLCLWKNWTDQPGHRKVHTQPIPRLGGLMFLPSVAISFIVVMLVRNYITHTDEVLYFSTLCMALGALTIYLVGLVDDFRELPANTKFLVQFLAALIFPLCNLQIADLGGFLGIHEIPFYMSYPITVFVILLITNAMNLIDGIDGLASGLSILVMACFTVVFGFCGFHTFAIIAAAVMGSLVVFFCFNVWGRVGHKKIFMGDSGSLFLGYVIAYLCIKYQMLPDHLDGNHEAPLLLSYTLVIVPTFDVLRVAITRLLDGKGMFTPDKTHIHHRIMAMGMSMHQTLVVILALFAVFCGLNYCLYQMNIGSTIIVATDVLLYSIFIWLTGLLDLK